MKKKEAMIKTLADGTRVRKSTWVQGNFVYYCQKGERVLWPNGELYSAFPCNMEEDGWEVYREKIVAKGVAELFEKHKEVCQKSGKDKLRWQSSFGVIWTYTDSFRSCVFARKEVDSGHVIWDSRNISETFTLLDDAEGAPSAT